MPRPRARPRPVGALALLGALALPLVVGCESPAPAHAVAVRTAAAASVAPLEIGDTLLLVAEARRTAPHAGVAPPVYGFQWQSSDRRVAEVTARGLVVARGPGAATISAHYGGATGALAVRVVGP